MRLYVVGGQQRGERPISAGLDWYEFQKGVIVEVDTETGGGQVHVEYISPPEACVDEDPVVLFKSATLIGDRFFVCTQTEVLVYEVPAFRRVGYVSIPLFNDVHHVRPTQDGTLLVANSGLDMVVEVALDGRVVRELSVLDEDPWSRFSRTVDYRKVRTTKPHHAHPNYVFCLGDEVWATRFEQRDAVSLTRPGRRIDIGLERVHDGVVHAGRIYFTTVNGKVVEVDAETLVVERVLDLAAAAGTDTLLGWARGICVDDDGLWVGFSRIRPTKFRENVAWALRGFRHVRPTHIAHFDPDAGEINNWIDLEPIGLTAIFSVHGVPVSVERTIGTN